MKSLMDSLELEYSEEGIVLTPIPRSEMNEEAIQRLEDFDRAFNPIKCRDCGENFLIPYGEINFFWRNDLFIPKRCPECREKRRSIKLVINGKFGVPKGEQHHE